MTYAQEMANRYNSTLWHKRRDVQWIADNGDNLRLVAPHKLQPFWKPEDDEASHIHAKVANFIRDGWTQEQFNALVDSGKAGI